MAKPTPKDSVVNEILSQLAGMDREATIRADTCMMCGGLANRFKDMLSAQEHCISGMCQGCQDNVFK